MRKLTVLVLLVAALRIAWAGTLDNLKRNFTDGQKTGTHHGALWRVSVPTLEVHTTADAASKVVHTFKRGEIIEADIRRGGSDEVLRNAVDSRGNTWMPVRNTTGSYNWWVRASQKTLRPVMSQRPSGVKP